MKTSARNPIDEHSRRFPMLLCAALEEQAGHLDARKRRVLAQRFERWAAQLILSAQLIEAGNRASSEPACLDEVVSAHKDWPDLDGKTVSECLAEAARLADRCQQIRLGLAVAGYIEPDHGQAERRQFLFPN